MIVYFCYTEGCFYQKILVESDNEALSANCFYFTQRVAKSLGDDVTHTRFFESAFKVKAQYYYYTMIIDCIYISLYILDYILLYGV